MYAPGTTFADETRLMEERSTAAETAEREPRARSVAVVRIIGTVPKEIRRGIVRLKATTDEGRGHSLCSLFITVQREGPQRAKGGQGPAPTHKATCTVASVLLLDPPERGFAGGTYGIPGSCDTLGMILQL